MRGAGRALFAATLLLIAGTLNIIYGIGALDDANIFVNDKRFIFTNLNTMGWVLIVLGVIQLAGGVLPVRGQHVRPGHRDRRRRPRGDRGPAVHRRRLPLVVARDLLPVRVHRPRDLHLRRREATGSLSSEPAEARLASPQRVRRRRRHGDHDARLRRRAPAAAPPRGAAGLRRLTRARADRGQRHASAACRRARGSRPRPAAALELRLGVRALARRASPCPARAVGQRGVRRHAHERDPDTVPAPRAHAPTVALAADVMATSIGTHIAYVAAVAAVDDGIRRRTL